MFDLEGEQWSLVAALFVVAVILGVFPLLGDELKFGSGGPTAPRAYEAPSIEAYEPLAEKLQKASEVPDIEPVNQFRLFASRLLAFDPKSGKIDAVLPERDFGDGLPISWKQQYGFDIADASVADADPDKDGFSNIEEYLGEDGDASNKEEDSTNPLDGTRHPPQYFKLYVKDYEQSFFNLLFVAKNKSTKQPGKLEFQLKVGADPKGRGGKNVWVHIGETVGDYVVKNFEEKVEERLNSSTGVVVPVEVHRLTLEHQTLGSAVDLIYRKHTETNNSTVELGVDIPGLDAMPSRIKVGETFKIGDAAFQLVDAGKSSSSIKVLTSGVEYTISTKQRKKVRENTENSTLPAGL